MSSDSGKVGQLIISSAGRDKGNVYMIVGIQPPSFVLLADGKSRGLTNPKKKNVRHVTLLKSVAINLAELLLSGANVSDDSIRHAIALLVKPDNL